MLASVFSSLTLAQPSKASLLQYDIMGAVDVVANNLPADAVDEAAAGDLTLVQALAVA